MSAINDLARADAAPVAVRHVCDACARAVRASGVGLYVVGDLALGEPVYATDPVSERVAEWQVTLGEGPATRALVEARAVEAPDLASGQAQRDWPAFTPAALAAGVCAVFAFPLLVGAITVGALEVYRVTSGGLSSTERADALLFADIAMGLILDRVHEIPTSAECELFACEFGGRWVEVHQATGMVSVQLDTDLATAFLRLRVHAFLTNARLSVVAHAVVECRLRFTPDTTNDSGTEARE